MKIIVEIDEMYSDFFEELLGNLEFIRSHKEFNEKPYSEFIPKSDKDFA